MGDVRGHGDGDDAVGRHGAGDGPRRRDVAGLEAAVVHGVGGEAGHGTRGGRTHAHRLVGAVHGHGGDAGVGGGAVEGLRRADVAEAAGDRGVGRARVVGVLALCGGGCEGGVGEGRGAGEGGAGAGDAGEARAGGGG